MIIKGKELVDFLNTAVGNPTVEMTDYVGLHREVANLSEEWWTDFFIGIYLYSVIKKSL